VYKALSYQCMQHWTASATAASNEAEEESECCVCFERKVRIRQHTSAYVSIRQHTSAYVSIRQHTSAYEEESECCVCFERKVRSTYVC
jgi:hypothetical protein